MIAKYIYIKSKKANLLKYYIKYPKIFYLN